MAVSKRGFLCVIVVLSICGGYCVNAGPPDSWQVIVENAGVCAMQATLMRSNRVVFFDRTNFGASNITYQDGYCRENPKDMRSKRDCTAHSVAVDLATNKITTLKIFTDTWCSSGSHKADGTLLQTGGWADGADVTRTIGPGPKDDWIEYPNAPSALLTSRWYSSNHILPDNRVIIVGGRRAFSFEFQPRTKGEGLYSLPFLRDTLTPGSEHNLYPFVNLCPDGNLFIFANQDSILLDYKANKVLRKYPRIPEGPRNYPASAAAALLPLTAADGYGRAEILICGGAKPEAFSNTGKGIFDEALSSCARMVLTDAAAKWRLVYMPIPRIMGDMLILPTAEVLIINGARKGTAGWQVAREPVLTPVTYDIYRDRFFTWRASTIPRLYHSVALMLPDGKVFVAGSNTNRGYEFSNVQYPTELRIEKYSPYYIAKSYDTRRPKIVSSPTVVKCATSFRIAFEISQNPVALKYHLYAPPFTTHTYSMNQRMLVLKANPVVSDPAKRTSFSATLYAPPNTVIAPAGYYLLTVINQGTPSPSVWVRITAA
ncbi:aldehyde oxidase GLOX [Physcomitrium patens]|uniref:Galactose oxidase-like Early set domain-containing protein n=1 Tax=Physcomitrium patens TaxID=3218 RepID=A0A2K1IMR1_PHYPA|nr:aldehyde oxidase GLOX-like [Physcomitrium patens]PNR30563.1 hypothetical protein PHYPA_026879 [Physcomitrium patens]|eukprot:XP_024360071.1 aldehyde oxidase GLOX-like [Physcomitrella patens]